MLANRLNRLIDTALTLPIYAVVLFTFWLPGYEKLFDRGRTIPYYTQLFESSILGRLGLTNLLITFAGVLELLIVVITAVSLARREYRPATPAPLLKLALFLSATTFVMFGFGLKLIQNHAGSANQFFYLGVAMFFLALVQYRERAVSAVAVAAPPAAR